MTFENLEHDFPQRVIYWREGDVLHARVEGDAGGEARAMEWAWQRKAFPDGAEPVGTALEVKDPPPGGP